MLEFVKRYGYDVYSQNGEDGVIKECLSRMKIKKGVSIEFGAADGLYCSNTANLEGWARHMYDIDPSGKVIRFLVTPANVNELPECDLLSIDIDGNDYNVWAAYKGKPKIVIIEIHSGYAPDENIISSEGTSYSPMVALGIKKGYFLLCHTGNLIFIDTRYRKLFPEIHGDGLENSSEYFNKSWIKEYDNV